MFSLPTGGCITSLCFPDVIKGNWVNPRFSDTHEADTRVAFHAVHIKQFNPGNIVIRCNDIDILIIMLSNIQKLSQIHVWSDVGLDYNNSRTFIDVKGTADKLNHIQTLLGVYPLRLHSFNLQKR